MSQQSPPDQEPAEEPFAQWSEDWGEDREPAEPRRPLRLLLPAALVVLLLVVVVEVALLAARDLHGRPDLSRPDRLLALAPPPDLPSVGSTVDARVSRAGDVQVVTWIRSRQPLQRLRLHLPDATGLARRARADQVVVAADRRVVPGAAEVARSPRTYVFGRPSRLVYLSYTLHDVADRRASVAGRALLRATALQLHYPLAGPTRVGIDGATVLSSSCLRPGQPVPVPCGGPVRGRWVVELHGRARVDAVQAQVQTSARSGRAARTSTAG